MARVRSFRLLHPAADKVHLVASRSYLTYSPEELEDKLQRNPFSYLHVIHPEGAVGSVEPQSVRKALGSFMDRGWIVAAGQPGVAVYRQETESYRCTGWVVLLDRQAVENGMLRLHEKTLEAREAVFARYLSVVGCQAEPVLVARPAGAAPNAALDAGLRVIEAQRPDWDFTTADRVRHTVWLCGPRTSEAFAEGLAELPALYLADGHHRVASTLQVAEADGLLAYIIPEEELVVRAYHRAVAGGSLSPSEWLERLAARDDVAEVVPLGEEDLAFGEIGVLHATGRWRIRLQGRDEQRVDAAWLETAVLTDVFGVADTRNDLRMRYLAGTEDRASLGKHAQAEPDWTFFELHPVPTGQIKAIADAHGTFPPKSTWIEPKLRSGMFLHLHG